MENYEKGAKGKLKIYIGAAPGVGKSYQMLHYANDMKKSNIDIIVGLIETYVRKGTEDPIEGLELLPLKEILDNGINVGKVYSKDKIDDALHNFFRIGNLNALREKNINIVGPLLNLQRKII